jgi:hypothetical protein
MRSRGQASNVERSDSAPHRQLARQSTGKLRAEMRRAHVGFGTWLAPVMNLV